MATPAKPKWHAMTKVIIVMFIALAILGACIYVYQGATTGSWGKKTSKTGGDTSAETPKSQTNPANASNGNGGATPQPKAKKAEGGGFHDNTLVAFGGHNTTNNYTLPPTMEIAVPAVPNVWSDRVPATVHGPTTLEIREPVYVRVNCQPNLVYKCVPVMVPNCPSRIEFYHVEERGRCVPADMPWHITDDVQFKALRVPTTVIVTRQRRL